jgi:hypothetical protein
MGSVSKEGTAVAVVNADRSHNHNGPTAVRTLFDGFDAVAVTRWKVIWKTFDGVLGRFETVEQLAIVG